MGRGSWPIVVATGICRARTIACFARRDARAFGDALGIRIGSSRHDHRSNLITSAAKHGAGT
jgi:hypothetical protein